MRDVLTRHPHIHRDDHASWTIVLLVLSAVFLMIWFMGIVSNVKVCTSWFNQEQVWIECLRATNHEQKNSFSPLCFYYTKTRFRLCQKGSNHLFCCGVSEGPNHFCRKCHGRYWNKIRWWNGSIPNPSWQTRGQFELLHVRLETQSTNCPSNRCSICGIDAFCDGTGCGDWKT